VAGRTAPGSAKGSVAGCSIAAPAAPTHLERGQPRGPLTLPRPRRPPRPDKIILDRFWFKDDSVLDSDNLPDPNLIATEITGDLRTALEQMEAPQGDLEFSSAP
jgi:hypothetical protein